MCKKVSTLLLTVVLLLTYAIDSAAQGTEKVRNHNFEVAKNLDIFNAIYKNLDLLYVDTLNPQEVITAGIDGMLRSLDPYTEYYPESETKNLKMMITGKYAGIGALIRYHSRLKRVVIDEPYAGMPAAEAGLRKGDVILSIDDSLVTARSVGDVSSRLRGDAGTSFILRVFRPVGSMADVKVGKKGKLTGGKELKFKITRRNIKLPEIPYYGVLDGQGEKPAKVGYLLLNQFTEGCAKDVRRAFIELKKEGIESMILDLRGNGGGSEMEAVDLVSVWLPKGHTIVENRGKIRQSNHEYKTRLEPIDTVMPLAVLVNDETASASEITAGALQDLDRAVIIGTRTFGKGLVQMPLDMPYNTNLKLTTSRYYIPSGRCIQAVNYKRQGGTGYKERIADSLTTVFHTLHGREVRDGGGITPDITAHNDTISTLAYYLTTNGIDSTEVLFDYVVDYINSHEEIAEPRKFHISDKDFAEFRQRVIDSGFSYDPVSRKEFDDLVKAAKLEGYYDDAREAFDRLSQCLKHDVGRDIDRNAGDLHRQIEGDIITAYYYNEGYIEAMMPYDKPTQKAIEILGNPEEYARILRPAAKDAAK